MSKARVHRRLIKDERRSGTGIEAAGPPRKRPVLLAVSTALVLAWIVFLIVMAFRH